MIDKKKYYELTQKRVNIKNVDQVNREKFVLAGIDDPDLLSASIKDIGNGKIKTPDGRERKLEVIYFHFINNIKNFLNSGKGYLFSGPKGTGKTSLAVLILKAVINYYDKGINATFIDWSEYQDKYYFNTWSNRPYEVQEKANSWIDKNVMESKLLVIDDLAKNEREHHSVVTHLLKIINYRDRNNLSTIITMNIDFQTLDQKYDDEHDRLSDRLKQNNIPITFFGKSHRVDKFQKMVQETSQEFDNIERGMSSGK